MELEIGAILDGKVTGITKFGAFVALPGGRSGLVHISEVAYSYVNDVSEFLAVGQEVKVKVISIDENNRINLSIKQALPPPPRPERSAPRNDRNDRSNRRGGYNRGGEERSESGDRQRTYNNRNNRSNGVRANAPKEPQSFEDMMKQYLSESENRLSDLNRNGDRGGRRGSRRRGGN